MPMLMSNRTLAAVLVSGCLVSSHASRAQEPPVYVPFVYAMIGGETVLPDGTTTFMQWDSTLALFNNTDTTATYTQIALYGKGASLAQAPLCESTGTLAPHTGANIGGCQATLPDRGFGFLAI